MAAISDVQSGLINTFGLGNLSEKVGMIGTVLIWFLGIIFFGIIFGVGLYFYIKHKQFNQKVKIYGMVAGRRTLRYKTKGRIIPIGRAGDRVMILKKPKGRTLPYPTIYTDKDEVWYWEREDGELINFGLGDLDRQFKEAGAFFLHTDMRMERLGIEKNLEDRLIKKQTFWDKYGTSIVMIIFIVLVTIMLIVLFTRFERVAGAIGDMANSVRDLAKEVGILTATNPERPVSGDIIPVQTLFYPLINLGGNNG